MEQRARQCTDCGLPEPQLYESVTYRGGLRLEALGQPTVADRREPLRSGHRRRHFRVLQRPAGQPTAVRRRCELNAGVSNNFNVNNTSFQAASLNQTRRWNWGMIGGQMPYLSGGIQEGLADVDGEPAL